MILLTPDCVPAPLAGPALAVMIVSNVPLLLSGSEQHEVLLFEGIL